MIFENKVKTINVVSITALPPDTRAKIVAEACVFKTPQQVLESGASKDFSLKWLDHNNRIAAMEYRGIEVVLFFKRQVTRITMLPLETTSAVDMTSEADAWVAVNLLNHEYNKTIEELGADTVQAEGKVAQLDMLTKRLREENDLLQASVDVLEAKVKAFEAKGLKPEPAPAKDAPMVTAEVLELMKGLKPLNVKAWAQDWLMWALGFYPDATRRDTPPPSPPRFVGSRAATKRLETTLNKLQKALKAARKAKRGLVEYTPIKIVLKARKPQPTKAKPGQVFINPSPAFMKYLQASFELTEAIVPGETKDVQPSTAYLIGRRLKKAKKTKPTSKKKAAKKVAAKKPAAKKAPKKAVKKTQPAKATKKNQRAKNATPIQRRSRKI